MNGFEFEGKFYTISRKTRFLVESANGTSSYTLERGFGCEPTAAVQFYNELSVGGTKKKRLTMIDGGKRTVIARTS
jgi:hypothetical protein